MSDDGALVLRPASDILDHPRFPQVRARYHGEIARIYGPRHFPGRMPSDVRRAVLVGLIERSMTVEADLASVLTPTRLKEQVESFGIYGARQVDAYLARLVATGYIEIVPHPADRRVRAVRALEPMARWRAAMLKFYFTPLQEMFPDPDFDLILAPHPGFMQVFSRIATDAAALANAAFVVNRDPAYMALIGRGSGALILNAILLRTADIGASEVSEAEILALGDEFGRSRSHIRNLLAEAVDAGFLERAEARGQALRPLPRFIETANRFIADSLRSYENTFRRAVRAYRQG